MTKRNLEHRKKRAEYEGRVELALLAIKNNTCHSIPHAAETYNVCVSTLRNRTKGMLSQGKSYAHRGKLRQIEEESLREWIYDMMHLGLAPQKIHIRNMADRILARRGNIPPIKVGENWVDNFIARSGDLKVSRARSKEFKRFIVEDPKTIGEWFSLVDCTIKKYGILTEDIYNVAETGFAMGQMKRYSNILGTEARESNFGTVLSSGNREWITAIECISAKGDSLPPTIISKGKFSLQYQLDSSPSKWHLVTSDNGWTNNELGYFWLKENFLVNTNKRTHGEYRLLILDDHGSHSTPEFLSLCKENKIITLIMPPHTSHILQPLNVGCFPSLKQAYTQELTETQRFRIFHVDKGDFPPMYEHARKASINEKNIKSSFEASGLVPFDPNRVISKLDICIRTPSPSPPPPPVSDNLELDPGTPKNLEQMIRHKAVTKKLFESEKAIPLDWMNRLDQLYKLGETSFMKNTRQEKEIEDLRKANAELEKKEKKKENNVQ